MNFLGLGPGELLLIMVLALIVFGPGKLPEIGQGLGKAIREFRKATDSVTQEFNRELSLDALTRPQPSQPAAAPAPASAPQEPHPMAAPIAEEPHTAAEPVTVEAQQVETPTEGNGAAGTEAAPPARRRVRRAKAAETESSAEAADGSSVKRIRRLRSTRDRATSEETAQPQQAESQES